MHATDFGRTLIIANPAAQSGAAREVAERLQRFLDMTARSSQFDLVLTKRMGHAKELAAQAQGYRTVIALGGDGVIHEVVNGLMMQEEAVRPALAVLPVGSGNDFAQTLGIDDFSGKDFGALLTCELQRQDIGRIRTWNPASGSGEATVEYYDQTLSVGIDAAIGLGTTELRKNTGLTGAPLYTLSGLEQFGLRYRNYPMTVSFDGAPAERVRAIIMAIQLGPTYGSGYRICPDADPRDGALDVCYACGPVPRAVALPMFLSAKDGHHTKLPPVRMRRCRHAELTFEEPNYPIQADGEPIVASRIEVDILAGALQVWRPTHKQGPWDKIISSVCPRIEDVNELDAVITPGTNTTDIFVPRPIIRLLVAARLAAVGLFDGVEVLVVESALTRALGHLGLDATTRRTAATLKLRPQFAQAARTVLKLAAALARRHDYPRRHMLHAHGRVRRVHTLTARARCAKHLHLAVACQLLGRHLAKARILVPAHLDFIHTNTSPQTKNVTKGQSLCHIACESYVPRA